MQWPAWIGTIAGATSTGAIAVRLLDLLTERRRHRRTTDATVATAEITDAATIRRELWEEIERLRGRVDVVDAQLAASRVAYTKLMGEHVQLRSEHQLLRREHQELEQKYQAVTDELQQLRQLHT